MIILVRMVNVGIFGHSGRLGKPLTEILNKHPHADIVFTKSKSEGEWGDLEKAECIFLALPYGESKNHFPKIKDKRIIDLSIDHRLDDNWIYGLPELNREKISNAKYVANPGCYATSIILGLLPLKDKIKNVRITSNSGISGAGGKTKEIENILTYNEGDKHPQLKEIEKAVGIDKILFVPTRVDSVDRGILSIIFTEFSGDENLEKLYTDFYKSEPFIRNVTNIETKNVKESNFCDIKVDRYNSDLIIIAALDNLVKGGAGQAVQNFNIMYGFEETTALQ